MSHDSTIGSLGHFPSAPAYIRVHDLEQAKTLQQRARLGLLLYDHNYERTNAEDELVRISDNQRKGIMGRQDSLPK